MTYCMSPATAPSLAMNDNNEVEIAKQGGITAVLKALHNHPTADEVKIQDCATLNNPAANAETRWRLQSRGTLRPSSRPSTTIPPPPPGSSTSVGR